MQRQFWWMALVFLLGMQAVPVPVYAQPPAVLPDTSTKAAAALPPWYQGATDEQKANAQKLFKEALMLHEQLLRAQAVAKYQEALSHWENPMIRWNLALVFQDMGEYLLAYESIEKALAWQLDAFKPEDQMQMRLFRETLLSEHLAVIEARCFTPGAEVALDGKPWFRGPKIERKVIAPGEHVVTASKQGYFPVVQAFTLLAGKEGMLMLTMDMDGIVERRRWAAWKPWAVVGTGIGLGALGAAMQIQSNRHFDEDRRQASDCTEFCAPLATPTGHGRAVVERWIAIAGFAAGGGAVAAGLVFVYLNRVRASRAQPQNEPLFRMVPLVSGDAAGVSAHLEF